LTCIKFNLNELIVTKNWYNDKEDIEMPETGKELSEIVKVPFEDIVPGNR